MKTQILLNGFSWRGIVLFMNIHKNTWNYRFCSKKKYVKVIIIKCIFNISYEPTKPLVFLKIKLFLLGQTTF